MFIDLKYILIYYKFNDTKHLFLLQVQLIIFCELILSFSTKLPDFVTSSEKKTGWLTLNYEL